jgi:site-specific DNA-adenine methylase
MISYMGAKSGGMGKWIEEFIPKDIKIFSEPFSGMFNVYLTMDLDKYTNLEKVIYNDFNVLNANIFACARKYKEFYTYLENQECQQKRKDGLPTDPKFKEWFNQYQKEIFTNQPKLDMENPDFDNAVKYAYVLSQVFSGSKPESSSFIDLKGKYNCKFDSFRKKMNGSNHGKSILNHLDKITNVENMDFEDLMLKYDSPETYFYLDPPYFNCEAYYSNHEFGLDTHKRLADCIKGLKAKWSLSYYYFPQLEEWFPKDQYRWVEKEFNKISGAKKGKETSKSTELLIMNY